jgi:hypothetical protein
MRFAESSIFLPKEAVFTRRNGFHDLRRRLATQNAAGVGLFDL